MKTKHTILNFTMLALLVFVPISKAVSRTNYNLTLLFELRLNVFPLNHFDPEKQNGNVPQRAPMKRPTIGYDGSTLYLYGQFGDLTLQLLNDGTEEYTTIVPAGANEVVLPNCASGIYELQMSDDRYIYSCEIEIQ